MLTPAQVTAHLHAEIPLTRAMELVVSAWDGTTVRLEAPLAPSQNHADTAFGGAISTAGIMAGFCLLYLLFDDRKISTRVLIQKSSTEFLRPIDADFTSTATAPPADKLEEFLETIRRKRRSRIEIASQVMCHQTVCATHTGLFVAMLY